VWVSFGGRRIFFLCRATFPRQGPLDPSRGWRRRLVGEGGGKSFGGLGERGERANGGRRRVCFVATRRWWPVVVVGGRIWGRGEKSENLKLKVTCIWFGYFYFF
jgi:hypothetical protein